MRNSNAKERLRALLDFFNIKVNDLSAKTGVKPSALYNYLSGLREPKQLAISAICEAYNLNPAWLLGYDVPMFATSDAQVAEIAEVITSRDKVITEEEKALISAYRNADELTKQMVLRLLKVGE